MSVYNDGAAFRKGHLGIQVNRATAALPQSTAAAIFTIATGRVLVTSLIGEVTTIIQGRPVFMLRALKSAMSVASCSSRCSMRPK